MTVTLAQDTGHGWPFPPDNRLRRCELCDYHPPSQGHRDTCPRAGRDAANAAYRSGHCKVCHVEPYRPGGPLCESCWRWRAGRRP